MKRILISVCEGVLGALGSLWTDFKSHPKPGNEGWWMEVVKRLRVAPFIAEALKSWKGQEDLLRESRILSSVSEENVILTLGNLC